MRAYSASGRKPWLNPARVYSNHNSALRIKLARNAPASLPAIRLRPSRPAARKRAILPLSCSIRIDQAMCRQSRIGIANPPNSRAVLPQIATQAICWAWKVSANLA